MGERGHGGVAPGPRAEAMRTGTTIRTAAATPVSRPAAQHLTGQPRQGQRRYTRFGPDGQARAGVGVHHHHRPVAVPDRPGEGQFPGPLGPRGPGQRGGRSRRDPGARVVGDIMSVHRRVADAAQVTLDVAGGGDAREQRAGRVGRGDPDPDRVDEHAPAVQGDRVAGQGVSPRGVRGGSRRHVTGVDLLGVRPHQGRPAGDEGQRDQQQDRAGRERDDPAGGPAGRGLRGQVSGHR